MNHEERRRRREDVRRRCRAGERPRQIAADLGLTAVYVYAICQDIKRPRPPRPPGRRRDARNEAAFRRYQNGDSLWKIAADLGVSHKRVEQIVRQEAKRLGERLRPKLHCELPGWAVSEYLCDDTLTVKALAARVGVHSQAVRRALIKAGVAIRRKHLEASHRRFMEEMAPLYRRYLAGEYAEDLAAESGRTPAGMRMALHRYRRMSGSPRKLPRG